MRTRLASICLVASALLLNPTASFAQPKKAAAAAAPKKGDKGKDDKAPKGTPKKGDKDKPKEISLDEEEQEGPVTAGQMTEEAAQGKRLFDAERWSEAALVLKRVVDGETGDDEGNKQIAQYHLAISLYRLQFYQASYGIFSSVADKPNHLKFKDTLLWLSKLATQLPEPADIIERVGKYKTDQVAQFNDMDIKFSRKGQRPTVFRTETSTEPPTARAQKPRAVPWALTATGIALLAFLAWAYWPR